MRSTVTVLVMAAALAALPGCYGTPVQARTAATSAAQAWACYSAPQLECPDRPRDVCTGHDMRWIARCADDDSRWACQYADAGRNRAQCRRLE